MPVEFLPCGDTAFSVQFGFDVNRETSTRVLRFKAAVERAALPGVTETVPTYRALIVHYDPLVARQADLVGALEPLLDAAAEVAMESTRWRLPVCYDPEFAWDLEDIARTVGKTPEAIVEMHTSIEQYVYMVGFMLGYLHMGDLADYMGVLSRRKEPRLRLEAGAVVTALALTVVHTIASPGGWNVIGRTPAPLFDLARERPALVAPGDTVICTAITKDEFKDIEERAAAGRYVMEGEKVRP